MTTMMMMSMVIMPTIMMMDYEELSVIHTKFTYEEFKCKNRYRPIHFDQFDIFAIKAAEKQ